MTPFIGQIQPFGFNFAVQGWALCDGQLLPISANTALFSLLGTFYGGDGQTTFGLPDLRGRVPIHYGNGPGLTNRNIGSKGGSETHTLSDFEMPQHGHAQIVNPAVGNQASPVGGAAATANDGESNYSNAQQGQVASGVTTGQAGGGQPHNNLPPFLSINFSIALQGVYPSRA